MIETIIQKTVFKIILVNRLSNFLFSSSTSLKFEMNTEIQFQKLCMCLHKKQISRYIDKLDFKKKCLYDDLYHTLKCTKLDD